jgi:hypothetical protein
MTRARSAPGLARSALWLVAALAGCAGKAGAKGSGLPPPAPIVADAASAPGSPEIECNQVVADLRRYGQCNLLDDDRKKWIARWLESVEVELALAKNPTIDDASKQQIAVACRKAAQVLGRTAERCEQEAAARPR